MQMSTLCRKHLPAKACKDEVQEDREHEIRGIVEIALFGEVNPNPQGEICGRYHGRVYIQR
jgi:hypothetical protein